MIKLAIIGYPAFHSLSPYVFDVFNSDCQNIIKYNRVSSPTISDALQLVKLLELDGLNITAPFKFDVLEYLDKIDYQASNLNSTNTIKFVNGQSNGFNTDYFGILMTIWDNNIILNKQKVLILGAGAAGRTAAFAVRNLNSFVYIWDRNFSKSQKVSEEVGIKYITTDELLRDFSTFQYIVSTIPHNSEIFDNLEFNSNHVIFDTIYHHSHYKEKQNKFGFTLITGERWLINQAIMSYEIFLGYKPKNIPTIKDLEIAESKKHKSFVLIGFSGSGKTSIGNAVANNLNADFYDIDKIIEDNTLSTIDKIFEKQGETFFRQIENQALISLSNKINESDKPIIIAAGGGILTNPDNIPYLKQLGFIIWMYSPIQDAFQRIIKTNQRPLINNLEQARQLFNSRKDDYFLHSDAIFLNTSNEQESITRLTNEIARLL